MTAVASPPSVQSLPRWNSGEGVESLNPLKEEVNQFYTRKSVQRQSSSTPSSATSISSSVVLPSTSNQTNGDTHSSNGDPAIPVPRKKAARGLWPSSKADAVSGISTARPQGIPTTISGQSAASTMNSAINQNSSGILPPVRSHPNQSNQNGGRVEQTVHSGEPAAILALLPLTGTFERKQINVPFYPDTLRIGRQTNAKTIPTPSNGYFDSKVLSRQHAEVWADRSGKIWIRDVKSSNGTFVNGARLSPENRDSEPHELREQDTLELGIDIVSEDQKSIVHHKVSAKIELAGMFNSAPTLLDVNNVDPTSGQQFSGEPMGQPLSQMRRSSQGSAGNGTRMAGQSGPANGSGNIAGPQRQMNMWMAPITIEQVVRKLTMELKQAKQQSQDLHRTRDFFGTLMNLGPGQDVPKSPQKLAEEQQKPTASVSQIDVVSPEAISPFTQPPAPPPSQPLPEKPDSTRYAIPDALLKRTDTERPSFITNSAEKSEVQRGQIVSLLEALKTMTEESDTQGTRIKDLELALKKERKARKEAESRVSALSNRRFTKISAEQIDITEEGDFETPLDSVELMHQDLPNGHLKEEETEEVLKSSPSTETLRNSDDLRGATDDVEAPTSRLQIRLDLMIKEMDEMKNLMESYKRRAEDAEEGRRSLAEMVENIRAGREPQDITNGLADDDTASLGSHMFSNTSLAQSLPVANGGAQGLWTAIKNRKYPDGSLSNSNDMQQELERTFSNVLQQQKGAPGDHGRMVQSAPYISMVGVVIIGVGIMTWLNGWQPGGER